MTKNLGGDRRRAAGCNQRQRQGVAGNAGLAPSANGQDTVEIFDREADALLRALPDESGAYGPWRGPPVPLWRVCDTSGVAFGVDSVDISADELAVNTDVDPGTVRRRRGRGAPVSAWNSGPDPVSCIARARSRESRLLSSRWLKY